MGRELPHPGSAPPVVCVRGPSRSGKTALSEALIRAIGGRARVGWCKRTHHELDLPHKSSGRVWAAGAAVMAVQSPDRLQLTFGPGSPSAEALIAALPPGLDLVLFETHTPEAYPTFLAESYEPAPGEHVLGRFRFETVEDVAAEWADALLTFSRWTSPAFAPAGAPRRQCRPDLDVAAGREKKVMSR